MLAVLEDFSCKLLGSLWACTNRDFQESRPFTWCRFAEVRKGWSRQQNSHPAILITMSLKQPFPVWCHYWLVCVPGISDAFMGFRLCTHACKFLTKNLCLVLSEEHPDQSDWYITHRTVCFWLSPILAAPHTFLISSFSEYCYPSFIHHLTSWWEWCSGTLGKRMHVDGSAGIGVSLIRRGAGETKGSLPWMQRALSSQLDWIKNARAPQSNHCELICLLFAWVK